jgi:hypothetical protein
MARFFRPRRSDREWVQRLPARFSLDELRAEVGPSELRAALSWLYDAIERGRIEPLHLEARIIYRFVGDRRSGDGLAGTAGASPTTPRSARSPST